MKFIKTIGACFIAVTAASGALAPVSFAGGLDPEGFGPLAATPFAHDVPATASMTEILAKEMAVLTGKGISSARARQAIRVQGDVARQDLVGKVEAAAGSAYGGAWFEPATAQVHIGTTSHESRAAAEGIVAQEGLAGDVTLTPVRSTWAQLQAAQKQWNRRLAALLAPLQFKTALSAERNAVDVTLSSSVPAPVRAAREHEASNADVNVFVTVVPSAQLGGTAAGERTECNKFETLKAFCNKPITSGVTIAGPIACKQVAAQKGLEFYPTQAECEELAMVGTEGEWIRRNLCTAGPLAIPKANVEATYLLTAGHCGAEGQSWSSFYKNGAEHEIGKAKTFTWALIGDYGEIPVEQAAWTEAGNEPVFAVTAEWKANNERSYHVIREGPNMENTVVCHDGQTSGGTCGEIKKTGVTEEYGGVRVEGLVEVEGPELKIKGGDSGGPFFFVEENKEVLMEGITVAVSGSEKRGWYEPLHTALNNLNLELLTKNNENRLQDKDTTLPLIRIALPGETYPLNLGGSLKSKSELRSEKSGSAGLEGTEFSILLHVAELTSLGTAVIEFLGVEEKSSKTKCNTPGDSETNGAVLIPNAEFHLVYTSLAPGAPLELGTLILFTKFVIECNKGALETTVTGPSTARVSVPVPGSGKEGDSTSLEIASRCSNTTTDIQEIPAYYNNNLELLATTLLANVAGTGNGKSCELIEGTTLLAPETGSSASMFSVLY